MKKENLTAEARRTQRTLLPGFWPKKEFSLLRDLCDSAVKNLILTAQARRTPRNISISLRQEKKGFSRYPFYIYLMLFVSIE
jgi:hypothetical protein